MVDLWLYNPSFLTISKSDSDFHYFDSYLKMSPFAYTWHHQKKICLLRHIVHCLKGFSFFLKVNVLWWIQGYNSSFPNISKSNSDFRYFDLCLKMSPFTCTWNDQKKINIFRDMVYCTKVVSFILKVFEVGSVAITQVF